MDFDGLGIELETFLLVGQELLNILTLISLQLNHLSHLRVIDDSAIACEFLLDHLQDLLLIELLRKTLNCGQGLATIALLNPYMDVVLRLFSLAGVFVSFGEGVCVEARVSLRLS